MSLRARREDNKCFQLVSVAWSHLRNHFAFTNQLAAANNVVYHLCYVCYVFPVYAASVDLDKEFFVLCHDLHSIKNQEEYWLKEVEFEHKSCIGPPGMFFSLNLCVWSPTAESVASELQVRRFHIFKIGYLARYRRVTFSERRINEKIEKKHEKWKTNKGQFVIPMNRFAWCHMS